MRRPHSTRTPATTVAAAALTALGLGASALPAAGVAPDAAGISAQPTFTVAATGSDGTVVRTLEISTQQPSARAGATSARAAGDLVAELPPTSTSGYAMAGVTWAAGTAADDTQVLVSTREDGTWSSYAPLDVEDQPGDAVGGGARGGTEPVWVGDADGIAVRVVSPSGASPDDLQVTTVEPDRSAAAVTPAGAGSRITGPVEFPVMPEVVTRREWGADPDLGDQCFEPRYGTAARAVVVHHTVNANDYSRSETPAILRSILAYHTQGQGWCDIGYNYLVDRFGRIYEGRAGGLRLPVRGAHAGDYNTDTVGISMIGDYDKARLTGRLKNAMVRLVGWRLGTSYAPAYGKTRIYDRRVPRILGHRDVMSTACPGRYGYAFLPKLRKRVQSYLSGFDSRIESRAERLGRSTTGSVYVGERWSKGGFNTRFREGMMLNKPGLGAHWLSDRALRTYRRNGSVAGRLGYPKTDVQPTDLPRVDRALFEGGGLYVTRRRAYAVHGPVFHRWVETGAITGSLGAPRSSVRTPGDREVVRFRRGRITWDRSTDELTVVYK